MIQQGAPEHEIQETVARAKQFYYEQKYVSLFYAGRTYQTRNQPILPVLNRPDHYQTHRSLLNLRKSIRPPLMLLSR